MARAGDPCPMDVGSAPRRGAMENDWARTMATVRAANTLMGTMQCQGFSTYTGLNFKPFKGRAMSAGDHSVRVMAQLGVFLKPREADFNAIYAALAEALKAQQDTPIHST